MGILNTFVLNSTTTAGQPLGSIHINICSDGLIRFEGNDDLLHAIPMEGSLAALLKVALSDPNGMAPNVFGAR